MLESNLATTVSSAWKQCRPFWFRTNTFVRAFWIFIYVLSGPFRRRFRFNPERLYALLLVRDIFSPLGGLVDTFQRQGILLNHIILLDTGSSAPDCLSELHRLQGLGCRCYRLPFDEQRFGPYAPWLSPAIRHELFSIDYPILITDVDLEFPDDIPDDWLAQLFSALNTHRFASKTSLPLCTADLTVPHAHQIVDHEKSLLFHPAYRFLTALLLRGFPGMAVCTTDTTLSLYRPLRYFSTLSVRLSSPYALRHLPWYRDFLDSAEFGFYTDNKLSLFGEWSSVKIND